MTFLRGLLALVLLLAGPGSVGVRHADSRTAWHDAALTSAVVPATVTPHQRAAVKVDAGLPAHVSTAIANRPRIFLFVPVLAGRTGVAAARGYDATAPPRSLS